MHLGLGQFILFLGQEPLVLLVLHLQTKEE
jgi:hypothetical protein